VAQQSVVARSVVDVNPEVDHYGVVDRLVPGAVVLDVGASTGQFARPALEAGATVVAVEPDTFNVIELRTLGVDRLTVLQCAVGGCGGIATLHTPDDPAAAATGCYTGGHDGPPYVPVLTLDTLLDLRPSWDVVKVDVEGAEYDTFASATTVMLGRVACFTVDTHRWTVGDEPRLDGIGHRTGGPSYEPGAFEALIIKLSHTHDVRVLGPRAPGATLLAVRL
jgi:FkbM family methyltransferase